MQLLFLAPLLLAASAAARHTEQLFVRPLPHVNKALAHFRFSTREPLDAAALAPVVLRQILTKYDAASLQLSFSVGQYSEARYGPPHADDDDTKRSFHAPFGARLQAAFRGDAATIPDRWHGVTSELGGVFSASLNRMDETTMVKLQPTSSAAEFGAYDAVNTTASHFLQATLAREELCTENLTPWLKMLPCRAHAGLGALIDPIRIVSGEYAMLSVYAARGDDGWRVEQQLTTVQPSGRDAAWSLGSLLLDSEASDGKALTHFSACPLASSSSITTEISPPRKVDLKTQANAIPTSQRWLPDTHQSSTKRPQEVVAVHRFQTGYGQVHGGLAVRLENRHETCAMRVTYNDVAPWYLRLYFHTFKNRLVSLDDGKTLTGAVSPTFDFVPAELRGRPNQFRIQVELPPRSAFVLSVQFEKVFVRLSEHPPDANRGFDIPPGVATFSSSRSCDATPLQRVVYSEPLLVALPTPDFSMPYNVITLTSTVVAFFAGSMLNTLLRKAPRIQRMLADKKTA